MITIGTLAKSYGKLPHQIREDASIYDLMVTNVLVSWENRKIDELTGNKKVPDMSQDEMMAILKKAKEGN
jgi:hypothetical protein